MKIMISDQVLPQNLLTSNSIVSPEISVTFEAAFFLTVQRFFFIAFIVLFCVLQTGSNQCSVDRAYKENKFVHTSLYTIFF